MSYCVLCVCVLAYRDVQLVLSNVFTFYVPCSDVSNDFRQVGGFPPSTPVSSTHKTAILLKVALSTINLTLTPFYTVEKVCLKCLFF
jgi:hypothetical protein